MRTRLWRSLRGGVVLPPLVGEGEQWLVEDRREESGPEIVGIGTVGPTDSVTVFAKVCRLRPVRIWVDNAGSVGIWKKGYSNNCRLCTTIVKAISVVAAGLGSRVELTKITRCSSGGAILADHLSKGKIQECFQVGKNVGVSLRAVPERIPSVLLEWACLPRPDDDLGHRILRHLAISGTPVLGYSAEY